MGDIWVSPPLKKRGLKKAEKGNVKVGESKNWSCYWNMLADNLAKRYNVEPTHSLDELQLLHNKFANNIRLFTAENNEELLAGIVIYDCGRTVHVQYIASTREKGREIGAVDAVVSYLVHKIFAGREWFDFGSSTTYEGGSLNVGLSRQKEMYGARTIIYQQYSFDFLIILNFSSKLLYFKLKNFSLSYLLFNDNETI